MSCPIIKISPYKIERAKIKLAASIIKKGGIVAFPTETFYALGADALNPVACEKIFIVKKRPKNYPLIILTNKKNDVFKFAKEVPVVAKKLIAKFWPGPLSLIFKKSDIIPDITTGGLSTVAIRMSSSKIALSLITEADTPITAPSANIFGTTPPASANEVVKYLGKDIDLIIDGGRCPLCIESTILDVTTNPATIIREGAIKKDLIMSILCEK